MASTRAIGFAWSVQVTRTDEAPVVIAVTVFRDVLSDSEHLAPVKLIRVRTVDGGATVADVGALQASAKR